MKICRIDVNIAARNVREMAMNDDTSSYADYVAKIDECVAGIETELEALDATNVVSQEKCDSYRASLDEWVAVGYEIIGKIQSGDKEGASNQIFSECVPALDKVISIATEIDAETDVLMDKAVSESLRPL